MLSEPVRVALDLNDHCVVQEPVQQGSSNDVVTKDLAPLLEAPVGGQDHGPLLVEGIDQLEEQIGAGGQCQLNNYLFVGLWPAAVWGYSSSFWVSGSLYVRA